MGMAFPTPPPLINTMILPFSLCFNSNIMKSRTMHTIHKYPKSTRNRASVLLLHQPRVFPVIYMRG